MSDPIFNGRGGPLPYYKKREQDWPAAWRLPDDVADEDQDVFGKMAYLADDVLLRVAVNCWDNCLRAPGAFEGVAGGMISAHARLIVGSGACEDLERAADAVRDAWLGMAKQAATLGIEGEA